MTVKKDLISISKKDKATEAKELLKKRKEKEARSKESKARAEKRPSLNLTPKEIRKRVVFEYIDGASTAQLAEKYYYMQEKINEMIEDHYRNLINAREEHALVGGSDTVVAITKLRATEVLCDEFFSLLSEPLTPLLSEAEALFAWIYVHKGDSVEAIEESGLTAGLFQDRANATYRRAVLTRSIYLQNKINVAQYIKELREKKYYSEDVTKQYVQELILEEIYKIKQKGDKRDAVNLRQLIELLGKSIGAFTEKIEIHEVDPSKSLDLLIEMAQESVAMDT